MARDSTVNQLLGILDGVKKLENVLVRGRPSEVRMCKRTEQIDYKLRLTH